MDAAHLKTLKRAEIQKVAKREGVKATLKTVEIIRLLIEKYPQGVPSPQGEEKPQRRSKRAVKSKAEEDEEVAERDLREDQPQERQPSPEAPPVAPKRASKRKQEGVIAADASSQPAKKQRTESEKPGASTRPKRERADTVAPSISRRPEKKTKSNAHKGKEPAEVEAQEESAAGPADMVVDGEGSEVDIQEVPEVDIQEVPEVEVKEVQAGQVGVQETPENHKDVQDERAQWREPSVTPAEEVVVEQPVGAELSGARAGPSNGQAAVGVKPEPRPRPVASGPTAGEAKRVLKKVVEMQSRDAVMDTGLNELQWLVNDTAQRLPKAQEKLRKVQDMRKLVERFFMAEMKNDARLTDLSHEWRERAEDEGDAMESGIESSDDAGSVFDRVTLPARGNAFGISQRSTPEAEELEESEAIQKEDGGEPEDAVQVDVPT